MWDFISPLLGGKNKFIFAPMDVEKARIYVLSVSKCTKTKESMKKNPEYINPPDF